MERELETETGLFANTTEISTGNGGNVQITTPEIVSILNGGQITVDSEGTGNGGNLSISAGTLTLNNQSELTARTQTGQEEQRPSSIILQIESILSLQGDSKISAQAFNNANGGNVTIDADFIIAFFSELGSDGNDILATAEQGNGGRISITVQRDGIFGLDNRPAIPGNGTNDIDVSGDFDFGIIQPTFAVDIQPQVNIIQLEETTQQACEANRESAAKNGLTISGKGGILPDPASPLNSLNVTVDGESTSASAIPAPIKTSKSKIQPARGITLTESGEIILTAYRTESSRDRIPGKRSCS